MKHLSAHPKAPRGCSFFVGLGLALTLVGMSGAVGAAEKQAQATPRKKVLLVTGIDYPGHLWRQTAPQVAAAVSRDLRMEVFTVEDPHFLDSATLTNYAAVILHFQNWETAGPGVSARNNLKQFVASGGGLLSLHFACGAWHGEWPEFVQILGRVYDPKLPPHDPYGRFTVRVVDPDHPVTRGLGSFDTTDELYTCLAGAEPIHVLATATSVLDKRDHPMVFVREYGQGRVFLTTLGHDVRAITNSAVPELIRRGTAWASGLQPVDSPVP